MTSYLWTPPPAPSLPVRGKTERLPVNRLFFVGRNYQRGAGEQTLRHFVVSDDSLAMVVDDRLIAHVAEQGEPYTEGRCSPRTEGRFTVEFVNLLNEPISMQWIGFDCQANVLRQIPAKGRTEEATFPGHVFRFVDSTGRQLRSVDVATDELVSLISEH